MTRTLGALTLALSGCFTEADCDRRIHAAHLDALRDAELCRFEPDALDSKSCNLDQRPRLTYYGVYCSTASLDCVRGDADARSICFGRLSDTGLEPPGRR